MLGKIVIAIAVFLFTFIFFIGIVTAEEWVKFEGMTMVGDKLELAGILSKPSGNGPFPAVVMLCGCGGIKGEDDSKQQAAWAERLSSWGYVTLSVDSLTPRNFATVCENGSLVNDRMTSSDAFCAKSYLVKLNYVNPKKISVIGWSQGGLAVMKVIDALYRDQDLKPFQVAIAFYPYCSSVSIPDTPLLILTGAKDDWCPARYCENLQKSSTVKDSKYEFKLKLYPNASHAFDFEGLKKDVLGHHVEYDPEATADAIMQVKEFLAKYTK